ncbi:MAG: hypothetical protein FWG39_01165 [Alphaproteobacteria bacterium]|nr:hypothetical protein [Alphaproteobacteria bacterium]
MLTPVPVLILLAFGVRLLVTSLGFHPQSLSQLPTVHPQSFEHWPVQTSAAYAEGIRPGMASNKLANRSCCQSGNDHGALLFEIGLHGVHIAQLL